MPLFHVPKVARALAWNQRGAAGLEMGQWMREGRARGGCPGCSHPFCTEGAPAAHPFVHFFMSDSCTYKVLTGSLDAFPQGNSKAFFTLSYHLNTTIPYVSEHIKQHVLTDTIDIYRATTTVPGIVLEARVIRGHKTLTELTVFQYEFGWTRSPSCHLKLREEP